MFVAFALAAPAALAQDSAQDEYVEALPGATGKKSQKRGGSARTADRDGAKASGGGSSARDEALLDEVVGATAEAGPAKRAKKDDAPAAITAPPSYSTDAAPSLPSTVAGAVSDPADPVLWLILFGLASLAAAAFVRLRRRRTSVE